MILLNTRYRRIIIGSYFCRNYITSSSSRVRGFILEAHYFYLRVNNILIKKLHRVYRSNRYFGINRTNPEYGYSENDVFHTILLLTNNSLRTRVVKSLTINTSIQSLHCPLKRKFRVFFCEEMDFIVAILTKWPKIMQCYFREVFIFRMMQINPISTITNQTFFPVIIFCTRVFRSFFYFIPMFRFKELLIRYANMFKFFISYFVRIICEIINHNIFTKKPFDQLERFNSPQACQKVLKAWCWSLDFSNSSSIASRLILSSG